MRVKKLDKKLTLNKKTVVDLSKADMGDIQGGMNHRSDYTCFDCGYTAICTATCWF